jgi:hypothetical protein
MPSGRWMQRDMLALSPAKRLSPPEKAVVSGAIKPRTENVSKKCPSKIFPEVQYFVSNL